MSKYIYVKFYWCMRKCVWKKTKNLFCIRTIVVNCNFFLKKISIIFIFLFWIMDIENYIVHTLKNNCRMRFVIIDLMVYWLFIKLEPVATQKYFWTCCMCYLLRILSVENAISVVNWRLIGICISLNIVFFSFLWQFIFRSKDI